MVDLVPGRIGAVWMYLERYWVPAWRGGSGEMGMSAMGVGGPFDVAEGSACWRPLLGDNGSEAGTIGMLDDEEGKRKNCLIMSWRSGW